MAGAGRPEPRGAPRPSPGWVRELRKAVSWHRKLLASGLLAGSVALMITALSPPPPVTVQVVAAAADLGAGTKLASHQLRLIALPEEGVPAGALRQLRDAVGNVLAGPVRRGEAVTDVRLVGPSLVATYGRGMVAVPIRIADAASTELLQPGDVIDVLAAASDPTGHPAQASARLVASAVPVLTLPRSKGLAFGNGRLDEGALIVVATTEETASRLAAAAVASRLSLTIRPPDQ